MKKKNNSNQIEDLNLHLNKKSSWSRDSKRAYEGGSERSPFNIFPA